MLNASINWHKCNLLFPFSPISPSQVTSPNAQVHSSNKLVTVYLVINSDILRGFELDGWSYSIAGIDRTVPHVQFLFLLDWQRKGKIFD
jgi:hypothetical protein